MLSFDCGGLTEMMPSDVQCVTVQTGKSCFDLGSPVSCKVRNRGYYRVMVSRSIPNFYNEILFINS